MNVQKKALSRCREGALFVSRIRPGRKEHQAMKSITREETLLNVIWILASALMIVLVMK